MKLALLCSVAFLAASSPVLAADLIEPVAAMPFSWTGFYGGVQAGGGWNDSRWSQTTNPTFNTNGSGGIFGGQIGYNYQINQFVVGVEGDFAGSTVKGDNQCSDDAGTVKWPSSETRSTCVVFRKSRVFSIGSARNFCDVRDLAYS